MSSRRPRTDFKKLTEQVCQLPPETILRAAARCDGHGILKPEALTDAGFPAEVVAYLTTRHQSDGSPKGTIFVNGEPVKELTGVYGLDALRFIADALDLKYQRALGRGTEAANIRSALHRHLGCSPNSPAA